MYKILKAQQLNEVVLSHGCRSAYGCKALHAGPVCHCKIR